MNLPNGNGFTVKSVVWIVLAAVLYWPVSYIKESHDAVIVNASEIATLKKQVNDLVVWRGDISKLAAERGKEIPALSDAVRELRVDVGALQKENRR